MRCTAANLTCGPNRTTRITPHRIIKSSGGTTFGITSVLDPETPLRLVPPSEQLTISDPFEATRKAVETIRDSVDVVVRSRWMPQYMNPVTISSRPVVVETSFEGRHVGRLDLVLGARQRIDSARVQFDELDRRIPDNLDMVRMLKPYADYLED
jgi:2',3'-cyclic-nucleotide 2'-phosphodiesterase (5'-nucleotidase family)